MRRDLTSCEVVAIGDELLLGDTVDGNGAWLGRALGAAGIPVVRRAVVGDEDAAIRDAVAEGLVRTGCVLCSGGLGPTRDDLTKPAVAALLGRDLVLDAEWLEVIAARFRERGLEINERSRGQAIVPRGSTILHNARGTAPGIAIDDALGIVVLLPGVPHELRGLVEDAVVPWLRMRAGRGAAPVMTHRIRTTGIAESVLAERIDDLIDAIAPVTVAFLPSARGVDLRLTARGIDAAEADARFAAAEARIRERAGSFIYATGDDDFAAAIGRALIGRGLTLAVAESCTGGLLASWLTDAAGSSAFFLAGFVTYSNQAKQTLGVQPSLIAEHGAVSEAVAAAMAEAAMRTAGADAALAITGIAGPGGGTEAKPVGTVWVAAALHDRSIVRLHRFRGDRAEIRARSAQAALFQLHELLAYDSP